MTKFESEVKTIREAKTSLDNKAVCINKRREIITRETKPFETEISSDPDSAWSNSNYVPFLQVKLMISETLRTLGNKLTEQTKKMLESVLNS